MYLRMLCVSRKPPKEPLAVVASRKENSGWGWRAGGRNIQFYCKLFFCSFCILYFMQVLLI